MCYKNESRWRDGKKIKILNFKFLILVMFLGQYQHKLDEKNRIIIPAKFRDFIGKGRNGERCLFVTIRRGELNNFLMLFTKDTWQKRLRWIKDSSLKKKDYELFLRKLSWDSEICKIDKQWRLILPKRFIEQANLKQDVMILGVNEWIEIWDAGVWEEVDSKLTKDVPQMEDKIFGAPLGEEKSQI